MNVIVVGATGRVGQATVEALVDRGHKVSAAGRDLDKITESENVTTVQYDVNDELENLSKIIDGHDAVIFTAGSRNTDLLKVDAFGVVKTAEAAKRVNVSRFILLGAKWASYPKLWTRPDIKESVDQLYDYYIAKYFANNYLMREENLDFTIIEPDELLDKSGTGTIEINNMSPVGTPIPDVAEVLVESLENDFTIHRVYTINDGENPIVEALNDETID